MDKAASRTWSCDTLAAGDAMLEGSSSTPGGPAATAPLKRVKTEPGTTVDVKKRVLQLEMELAALKALTCFCCGSPFDLAP